MSKRIISFFLAMIMLLSFVVVPAGAEGNEETSAPEELYTEVPGETSEGETDDIMALMSETLGQIYEDDCEDEIQYAVQDAEQQDTRGDNYLTIRRFTYLPFLDVRATSWFAKDVSYSYKNGIMTGGSSIMFYPYENMTRGMTIFVIYKILGDGKTHTGSKFTDVKSSAYYASAVYWGVENKIIYGTSAKTFSPNDPVKRQDVCVMLYRALIAKNKIGGGRPFPLVPTREFEYYKNFKDYKSISDYAITAVNALAYWGIIAGDNNGNVNPRSDLKRCECCAIINRIHIKLTGHKHTMKRAATNATYFEEGGIEEYCEGCGYYCVHANNNKPMITPEQSMHFSCYQLAGLTENETLLVKEILTYLSRVGTTNAKFRINTKGLFYPGYNVGYFYHHIGFFFTLYYANYAAGVRSAYYNDARWYFPTACVPQDIDDPVELAKAVYAIDFNIDATKMQQREAEYTQAIIVARSLILSSSFSAYTLDQKIQRIFDWMASNVVYVKSGNGYDEHNIPLYVSAYDALVKKETNCYGYAFATLLFMEAMNVPCHICIGSCKGSTTCSNHAWVVIKTNAGWRYYDPCWYSGYKQNGKETEARKYYAQKTNPHATICGFDWLGNYLPELAGTYAKCGVPHSN